MYQADRFWDRHAEGYSRRPIADQAAYEKKLMVTREYLRPDMEVLEIGCGTGSTAIALAAFVKHILATDFSSNMIEIATSKAEAVSVDNVTFETDTIDDIDIPDQSLDAAFGFNILHLLEDKSEIIGRVHRMLKPGGIFVTSTACLGDTMKFFKVIAPIGRFLRLLPLVQVFTKKELEDSFTAAGFEIAYQWQPGKGKGVFIVAKK